MSYSNPTAPSSHHSASGSSLLHSDLDALSDAELEAMLFADDAPAKESVWNLPTVAGLGMAGVGTTYLLQELGLLGGVDLEVLVAMLPWIAGVLIVLIGLGTFSCKSGPKRRDQKKNSHRLTRSTTDRKIFGVCGGLAERLGIDSVFVRIAFIAGLFPSGGMMVPAYLLLAYALPKPTAALSPEKRWRIIRES